MFRKSFQSESKGKLLPSIIQKKVVSSFRHYTRLSKTETEQNRFSDFSEASVDAPFDSVIMYKRLSILYTKFPSPQVQRRNAKSWIIQEMKLFENGHLVGRIQYGAAARIFLFKILANTIMNTNRGMYFVLLSNLAWLNASSLINTVCTNLFVQFLVKGIRSDRCSCR